jgi:hypothetical protein
MFDDCSPSIPPPTQDTLQENIHRATSLTPWFVHLKVCSSLIKTKKDAIIVGCFTVCVIIVPQYVMLGLVVAYYLRTESERGTTSSGDSIPMNSK